MELSQVVIQGDDPVSWTSSWGWVNCSLETCGKRWNHGFSSHFLSLSISILTILLLKILHEGSAERPEHGRSTAYAECTKCAGDAQRCSSWIEWHGVWLRTECPERRVTDGRDGWIWMFPKIGVPPHHPILIGFSIINFINHPYCGTPIFGNTHMVAYLDWNFYQNTSTIIHFILDFPEFSPQPIWDKPGNCRSGVAEGRKAPSPLWHRRALEFSGDFPKPPKKHRKLIAICDWCITRWWQLKYFLCSPLPGEMIRFNSYSSNGLKTPSPRYTRSIVALHATFARSMDTFNSARCPIDSFAGGQGNLM